MFFAGQIWLTQDLTEAEQYDKKKVSLIYGKGPGQEGENDFNLAKSACPYGTKLPDKSDFEKIIASLKNEENQLEAFKEKFNPYMNEKNEFSYIGGTCVKGDENMFDSLEFNSWNKDNKLSLGQK